MTEQKPSYEQLEARVTAYEAVNEALRVHVEYQFRAAKQNWWLTVVLAACLFVTAMTTVLTR